MTMPGMLDMNQPRKPRRRGARSRFITRMFAVGIAAAMVGGGLAIVQNAPEADAASQAQINRYIRSEGGIPPCTHEDGSGQAATCVWWAGRQGNGKGYSYIAVTRTGQDDAIIYITGPQAVRR